MVTDLLIIDCYKFSLALWKDISENSYDPWTIFYLFHNYYSDLNRTRFRASMRCPILGQGPVLQKSVFAPFFPCIIRHFDQSWIENFLFALKNNIICQYIEHFFHSTIFLRLREIPEVLKGFFRPSKLLNRIFQRLKI